MKETIEKIAETKSNWECVAAMMEDTPSITLGHYATYWAQRTPRRMLHCLSYYKFAAKMIGAGKKVLDVGCNEGLGSWLLAKECGYCKGVDFDEVAVQRAKSNFNDPAISFSCEDFLSAPPQTWDAVTNFDVIEHIYPEHASLFLKKIADNCSPNGIAVIGTPSLISQQYTSAISKKGHVNIYSHERLEEEIKQYFNFVFLFSAHDEVVHTGYFPLAHYFIAVACKKKI